MTPIIFTDRLRHLASRSPRHSAPLLHRWAVLGGDRGEALREQIERAAALVPELKRRKVLGLLTGKSSSDDQVRAAVGSILLAKTLRDHGWSIEFEPDEAGGTPDFRIEKSGSAFVIEVRRVAKPDASPSDRDISRIRDALDDIETRTPISVRGLSISGDVSLKPFKRHMKELLAGNPSAGPRSFHEGGVYVGFYVHDALPEPMPAIFSWSGSPICGGQHEEVRAHIDEKLSKYKVPLIVALDFVDFMDPFTTVEEVLLGTEVMHIPIDLSGSDRAGEPYAGRADDSILVRRGADGDRARSRLQAVLAFGLVHNAEGSIDLHARVFGNPAAELPLRLSEFAPIPRLVVVEETVTERKLRYLGSNDEPFDPGDAPVWRHVP
jgi:hypothetical protein